MATEKPVLSGSLATLRYIAELQAKLAEAQAARAEGYRAGLEAEREKSRKAVDAACAAMADDLKARGYRKGLEEARKIAAAQYKAHMKQYEDGAKEHLAPAWSASGIVSQISAKLDDEETQ